MNEQETTTSLVSAIALSRRYRQGQADVDALKSATCVVRRRARIAIMGASGSGKSTLLHLMAGLDRPSEGHIEWPAFNGSSGLVPGRISVAFQSASLVPFLSVAENIALPNFVLGNAARADSAASAQLERFGLAELADKLPDELSGGQAQRAALARAIASEPQLLLADEPTGQLDHATGREVIATLMAWAEESGCALVIATHDAEVAEAFDDVWHMEHGRLSTANGDSHQ